MIELPVHNLKKALIHHINMLKMSKTTSAYTEKGAKSYMKLLSIKNSLPEVKNALHGSKVDQKLHKKWSVSSKTYEQNNSKRSTKKNGNKK